MNCPACGARNSDTAEWCTQCYESLVEPEPEPTPPTPSPPAAPPQPQAPPGATDPTAAPEPAPSVGGPDEPRTVGESEQNVRRSGQFRRIDDRFEWVCRVCDTWNEVGVLRCQLCGVGFGESVAPEEPEEIEVAEPVALVASALLPGVGHLLIDRTASGAVRVFLFLLWAVGAFLIGSAAADAGQSLLPAFPLLFGAILMWIVSLYDVHAVYTDSDQLLDSRVVLWSVVGVFGLTGLLFIVGVMRVSGS